MSYRIIITAEGDWLHTAKKVGDEIETLYEGDCTGKAYRAILKDLGVEVPYVEREMGDDGSYDIVPEDWE